MKKKKNGGINRFLILVQIGIGILIFLPQPPPRSPKEIKYLKFALFSQSLKLHFNFQKYAILNRNFQNVEPLYHETALKKKKKSVGELTEFHLLEALQEKWILYRENLGSVTRH